MTLWDPMRDFENLRQEIDRAFGGGGIRTMMRPWRLGFLPGRGARNYPLVNMHDDGENLYVEALAPGVNVDNLEITVVSNVLTIAGEKPPPADVPPEKFHRSERAAGRFVRSVTLPAEIDRDRVDAQYHTGLLLLTLPRSEAAKPRRIPVNLN